MKKIIAILLAVTLCFICAGCIHSSGRFMTTMCISTQTNDSFSMSYEYLNGEKTYSFDVKKGASLDVNFVTEAGNLTCVVTDKSGNEYYRNDDIETNDLTVELGDAGKYYVKITAKEHKGSFKFIINNGR